MTTTFPRFRIALLLVAALPAAAHARGGERWFAAWATSHGSRQTSPAVSGTTVRQIVRPTISGSALRVRVENTLGLAPVVFSGASVGVAATGAAVVPGSIRPLTFGGGAGLTLGPGEGVTSDPVSFHVEAFQELAVSLEVAAGSDISAHVVGLTVNYYAPGARAADASPEGFAPLPEIPALNSGQWPFYWIAAVDVQSPSTTGTVVLLGDSITDGRCSTRDAAGIVQPDLYQRWGDVMAKRLSALPANRSKGIANQGIAGNRILNRGNGPPALERLDRDVLARAGATHVLFFEGTNDISGGFTAAEVIAGMQEVVRRVHEAGLEIVGGTVIPRGRSGAGWTAAQEGHRLAVNAWMRSPEADLDGLVDFDAIMQGPIIPETGAVSIKPEYNCDNTHPNAAGYRAMGEFVDLSVFENQADWSSGP